MCPEILISHLLLLVVFFLVVPILSSLALFHHLLLPIINSACPLLLHLHLLLVSLHLSELLGRVLLHLVGIHLLPVAVMDTEFVLILAATWLVHSIILMVALLILIDLILQLDPVTADKNLLRLRNYLVPDDARLAVQATEVLDVALQLVDHHVVELPEVINVPVVGHGLVLPEIIFYQIDL